MEWNGNFGIEYGRCQNGMEWKTIFHTSILIPYKISLMAFIEKYKRLGANHLSAK